MKTGLLIVDIQNDYFPGGNMELVGMDAAAQQASDLLTKFRDSGLPVYHVQHLSIRPGATFFLPDTPGAEIHEAVRPNKGEQLIQKHFPNAFRETELSEVVKRDAIEHLVICGAMSHMCIDATTRAAFDLRFKCTVIENACATRDLSFHAEKVLAKDVHAAFMAALSVPYANVVTVQDYMKHRSETETNRKTDAV
ncbi:MAG: cysteine hydrolase family protein [Acidiferrobacterales bacterium]